MLDFYKIVISDKKNEFTTPYFLMKQAFIHEKNENYSKALLDIYKSIQSEYPNSKEELDIEKYISSRSNR